MRGWHGESMRHSLAARGIITRSLPIGNLNYQLKTRLGHDKLMITIDHDGSTIGWLEGDRRGKEIDELDLYVKHGYRNRGLAGQMFDELVMLADEHKFILYGEVAESEDLEFEAGLIEFYTRYGFEVLTAMTWTGTPLVRYPRGYLG